MAVVLFDGELRVQYGFGSLSPRDEEMPDMDEARDGQSNGLLGAGVPGALFLTFGLHTGPEPLRIEWSEYEPPSDEGWEEVVEASVDFSTSELALAAFDEYLNVDLPVIGTHRARFCALGMDAANELDSRGDDEEAPDRYLLQLWPAPTAPDAVLRQTSARAAYWNREARGEAHPVTPEQQDLEELGAAFGASDPVAQKAALIHILERVIAVTGLSDEPAATRVAERLRTRDLIRTGPDELTLLAIRLQNEAPPVPRSGQMDLHNMAWRRLQAGSALEGALYHPWADTIQQEYGPLYHARWALDDQWPSTRAEAIHILTRH